MPRLRDFLCIEQAIREIDHGIPQLIGKRVADIMSSNQGLLTGVKLVSGG